MRALPMTGAVFALVAHALAAAPVTVEDLIEVAGNTAIDDARRAIDEVKTVAEEIGGRWDELSQAEGMCGEDEVAGGVCQSSINEHRFAAARSKLRQAESLYENILAEAGTALRNVAAADRVADIDLDITAPEVDATRCKDSNAGAAETLKVNKTKAACVENRIGCMRSLAPIERAQHTWDLERVSFVFYFTFESVSKAVQTGHSAVELNIISVDLPASEDGLAVYASNAPLHRYLFSTLKGFQEMYWCYYADAATGMFVGYKRLATGDASSGNTFLYTFASNATGMVFYRANHLGEPQAEVRREVDWRLHDRAWFKQGMAAYDVSWTGLYSFAEQSDIGLTHMRRVGKRGLLAVDFFLNDVVHRFIDKVRVPLHSVFFVINEEGQLISSNKVSGVVDGVPVSARDVPNPLIAQTSGFLMDLYPSITDPSGHRVERRELQNTAFTTYNYGDTLWNVGVMATGGQMSGNTRTLRWTIVLMSPVRSDPTPSAVSGCITNAGCDAAVGGAVMNWRDSGINYITDTVSFFFLHARQALQTVKTDMDIAATAPADLSPEYFQKKLGDFSALSFFHMVDTKERKVYGWHREEGTFKFHNVSCEPTSLGCELTNIYEASADFDASAPTAVVETPWEWWGHAARTRVGHIVSFHFPYPFGNRLGRAFLYRDVAHPDMVFACGMFEDRLSGLLNGRNPDGTSVYMVDTSMLLLAATHSREKIAYAFSDRAPPEIRHTARALRDVVPRLRDDTVQKLDVVSPDDASKTYHVDYRRLITERKEWDPTYYWVVVVVRESLQVMRTDNGGGLTNPEGEGCVKCAGSLAASEARKQVLRDVNDALNTYVNVAPRAVLTMDTYFSVGFIPDESEQIYHHLETQMHRDTRLFWVGVYTKSSIFSKQHFYGILRETPSSQTVRFTEDDSGIDKSWSATVASLLASTQQLPKDEVWSWTGWRSLFGQEVLSAVRPVLERGEIKLVMAAGLRKDMLATHVFEDVKQQDMVIVDQHEHVLFSTLSNQQRIDDLRVQFLEAFPAYRGLASRADAMDSKLVSEADSVRVTMSAMAFRHVSAAWEALRPESYNLQQLQWTVVLRSTEPDGGCLGSDACQANLRTMLHHLHTNITTHVVESLTFMNQRVVESTSLEFSGLFRRSLNDMRGDEVYFVQRFLAHHVLLFPEVEYFLVHAGSTDAFMAVVPRPAGAGTQPDDAANQFANYVFVTCEEIGKCTVQEISQTGTPGAKLEVGPFAFSPNVEFVAAAADLQRVIDTTSVMRHKVHSDAVDVTVSAGSASGRNLADYMRMLDVPADTLMYIVDTASNALIASSRGGDNPLIEKSRGKLADPSPDAFKTVNFKFADTDYECMYTIFQEFTFAVVQKRQMQGHVEVIEVDMAHDEVCAERGACEAQVDELREMSYRAKADFIELRMQRFMTKMDAVVLAIKYAVEQNQYHLDAEFSEGNPIIAALISHVADPRVSTLQYDEGDRSVIISANAVRWKNATGVYSSRSLPVAGSLTKGEFLWRNLHEDSSRRWNLNKGSGSLSVRRILDMASNIAVFAAAGDDVLTDNVLSPFEGVVMDATNRERLVSNTLCQELVAQLEKDVHLLNSVMVSADVQNHGACSIDLRSINFKESGLPLIVGSIERDVHSNDYPDVAESYGCVTWAACEVAGNAAKQKLMDTTLQHVATEFAVAETELQSLRGTASIHEQLVALHYVQWIAQVSEGTFVGRMKSPDDPAVQLAMRCENTDCMYIVVEDEEGKVIPDLTFAYPPFKNREMTVRDQQLYYVQDGVAGGVSLAALNDWVEPSSKIEFEMADDYTRSLRVGMIKHSPITPSNDVLDAFVRVSDDVVLRTLQQKVAVPHEPEERCYQNCEQSIHRFRGYDVAAATAASAMEFAIENALAKVDLLAGEVADRVVVDRFLPSNPEGWPKIPEGHEGEAAVHRFDGENLCGITDQLKITASVGYFDGLSVFACIRSTADDIPPTYVEGVSTGLDMATRTRAWYLVEAGRWAVHKDYPEDTKLSFLNPESWGASGAKWSDMHGIWGVRSVGAGLIAVDATTDLEESSISLAADYGLHVYLQRNGAPVLGDSDHDGKEVTLSEMIIDIAEPFGQRAMWSTVVWTTETFTLPSPANLGCFTEALCSCEEEKLQAVFTANLLKAFRTAHAGGWQAVDTVVRAVKSSSKGLADPAYKQRVLRRAAEVEGVAFALSINVGNRSYEGYANIDGERVGFTCGDRGCLRDGTVDPLPGLPAFGMLRGTLGITASEREGKGYRLLDSSPGLTWFYEEGEMHDATQVGVAVGWTFDSLRAGLIRMFKEVPRGVEVIVLNSRTHTIEFNSAAEVGSPDVEAAAIAATCKRIFEREAYNPASELQGECGYNGRAYSVVAQRFGELVFAATVPRPSRRPTLQSASVKNVADFMRTRLEEMPYADFMYVVSPEKVLGVPRGAAALANPSPTHSFSRLQLKMRENSMDGYWVELQKPHYPFEGNTPSLTGYLPVRRGDVLIGFLATGVALGEQLNSRFVELQRAWGWGGAEELVSIVDPSQDLLAVSAVGRPNIGDNGVVEKSRDIGLYPNTGAPMVRATPDGVVSGSVPVNFPRGVTGPAGFAGAAIITGATPKEPLDACVKIAACDTADTASIKSARDHELQLLAVEAVGIVDAALAQVRATVHALDVATNGHDPAVKSQRIHKIVRDQTVLHDVHAALVQDAAKSTWAFATVEEHTIVAECADGATAGCDNLGLWPDGATQPAAYARTPSFYTDEDTFANKFRIVDDITGLSIGQVAEVPVARGIALGRKMEGQPDGIYAHAAMAFACFERRWMAAMLAGENRPMTVVMMNNFGDIYAAASSAGAIPALAPEQLAKSVQRDVIGRMQSVGEDVTAFIMDITNRFTDQKVLVMVGLPSPASVARLFPEDAGARGAMLEAFLPVFEEYITEHPDLHAIMAVSGDAAVGLSRGYRFHADAEGLQVVYTHGTPRPPVDPSWAFHPEICLSGDLGAGYSAALSPLPQVAATPPAEGEAPPARPAGLWYGAPASPTAGICVVKSAAAVHGALQNAKARDALGGVVAIGSTVGGGEPVVVGSSEEQPEAGDEPIVARGLFRTFTPAAPDAGAPQRGKPVENKGLYGLVDVGEWPWAIGYVVNPSEIPEATRTLPLPLAISQQKVRAGAADLASAIDRFRNVLADIEEASQAASFFNTFGTGAAMHRAVRLHPAIRYVGVRVKNAFTSDQERTFTGYVKNVTLTPSRAAKDVTEDNIVYFGCEGEALTCPHPAVWKQDANARSKIDAPYRPPRVNAVQGWYNVPNMDAPQVRGIVRFAVTADDEPLEVGMALPYTPDDVMIMRVNAPGSNHIVHTQYILSPHTQRMLESFDFTVSTGDVVDARVNEGAHTITFSHTPGQYGGYAVAHLVEHGRSAKVEPPYVLGMTLDAFNARSEEFVETLNTLAAEGQEEGFLDDVAVTVAALALNDNEVVVEVTVETLEGWEGVRDGSRFDGIMAAVAGVRLPGSWRRVSGGGDDIRGTPIPSPTTESPWNAVITPPSVDKGEASSSSAARLFFILLIFVVLAAGGYYFYKRYAAAGGDTTAKRSNSRNSADDIAQQNNVYAHDEHDMQVMGGSRGYAVDIDDDSDIEHI